jgi:murein DD-endopeptidase MepM/ murein hydrolase activator NlpD
VIRALACLVFAFVLTAAAPAVLTGSAVQGGLMQGHAEPGSEVFQDGKEVRVAPDGRFLVAFAYDAGPRSQLRIIAPSGAAAVETVTVKAREFEVQRIDNLPPSQVNPSKEDLKRIAAEQARLISKRVQITATPLYTQPFRWPVTGIVSGLYGSRRILNGEPRSPHLGVDIAASEGTPVIAPNSGIVVLVDDEFFTGNTVMLDHGLGLTSVFAHMSRVDVQEGESVAAGQVIGAVGMSGRATGPHLHWGVHLMGVGVDPALLAGPMPATGPPSSPGQ